MTTPKIKNLFQLIEFLHSNIENFNQYNEVINEVHLLDKERYILNPEKNFADKLKYDEIQAEIKEKFKVIDDNIINPVKSKADELNIWNPNEFETMHNWNIDAICDLINNFSKDDLPEIFSHKSKYLEYRLKTKGETFFTLSFFFSGLDEILKEIFDYFKEPELYKTDFNEFEPFEAKTVQVNDISEAVKLFQQGKFQKFTLPNSFLNPSTIQQQPNTEPLPPQPIVKQKPELNVKLITFKNSETIEKIHSELKGFFPNKEAELLKALQGEQLSEILLFPHNQNKFVEVFRRLKYNGFLLNTDTEIKNWICTTFQFVKKGFAEPQPFNESSVWDNLNKGKGEPTKKERICITDWLPYKSPLQLTRETENEKL